MRFVLTEPQELWRQEVGQFITEHLTPELKTELWITLGGRRSRGPEEKRFRRKLIERGWTGLMWPSIYGGEQRSAVDQFILMDELAYSGAPAPDMTVMSLGPIIMRHGTDADRERWLPKIIRGECTFALGYSEPDAGTDLANLQTRAVRDGDQWVINGQKTWNSSAHLCTHEWLAVRTDPEAPKHKGISIIIVPIDAPGVEIHPIQTWGDVRTNQVFFTDVRVPLHNLIGEVNRGWDYITGALVLERAAIGAAGSLRRLLDDLVDYCRTTVVDGMALAQRASVRRRLAELEMEVHANRLRALFIASSIDGGAEPTVAATISKVATTELRTKLTDWAMTIFGMNGQLNRFDERAPLGGEMEVEYRISPIQRFGGGTNEVMRDIIAQRGYSLPRSW